MDRTFCGAAVDADGPVVRRLRRYDPVKGIVFGHFGEASEDVHKLVSALALSGSLRTRHNTDADSMRGLLAWYFKRRWAIAAVRGTARLTLARLACVGHGAQAAAKRRANAENAVSRARRSACELFWSELRRLGRRIF